MLENLFSNFKVDTIVNFAAETHVDRSISNPNIFIQTNILGTLSLLNVALKHKVKKFIQISTDEVYGSLENRGYFTEESPLAPNSPYAASKASGDLLVKSYFETYGLNINITRCTNNYGEYQYPEKLIPLIITNAIDNKLIPIYGNGENVRDWLHVIDHCKAIDLVLNNGIPGEVYNIGGNNEYKNIDVAKEVLKILGKPLNLIRYVEDRPGHDFRYAINPGKINQLGWNAEQSFIKGLEYTVTWYLENQEWWNEMKKSTNEKFKREQIG